MTTLYDFTLTDINGNAMPLEQFRGKTVLLVNVASECGLTPQYSGLQEIYEEHKEDGFAVIGLPCNQFGAQEPGSEAEIKAFCTAKFSVTFPMTEKVSVNGSDRHPLYQWLIADGEDIQWNFEKFLINAEGVVAARFSPQTSPVDSELPDKIEEQINLGKILLKN